MRRFLFLVLIFILPVFLSGMAPAKEKKTGEKEQFYLDGNFGVAIPIGSYYKTDPQNKKSGFAGTGYLFQVYGAWMGKKDLGMALQYAYQRNQIQSAFQKDTLPGRTFPLGAGAWSNHYLMIGPVYIRHVKKLVINARVMGGLVFSFSPLFNYTSPDSLHRTVKSYGTGFGYGAGVGLGYAISSRIQVKVDVSVLGGIPTLHKQYGGEYMGTSVYFDTITGRINYRNVYAPAVVLDLKNYISTFNASLGVIIKL